MTEKMQARHVQNRNKWSLCGIALSIQRIQPKGMADHDYQTSQRKRHPGASGNIQLRGRARRCHPRPQPAHPLDQWKEWFSAHQTDSHFILAGEENGAAIGYASLSPEYRQKEAYASTAEASQCTSPRTSAGKRAGSALIGAVLDRAKECGTLHRRSNRVRTAGNEVSEKLHQKFGFAFCGTLHQVGFKHGKYHDIDNFELIFDRSEVRE